MGESGPSAKNGCGVPKQVPSQLFYGMCQACRVVVQGRTCKDQAKPALKINGNEEQAMNNIGIVQETALKAVRIATERV
jgi:hypothetical protein